MEILKTKKNSPPRILLHGDHKTGKSSLAAAAPNPLFIQTEDGLDSIDAQAFQSAQCRSIKRMNLNFSEKLRIHQSGEVVEDAPNPADGEFERISVWQWGVNEAVVGAVEGFL